MNLLNASNDHQRIGSIIFQKDRFEQQMFKLENQLENSNYGWLKDESHVEHQKSNPLATQIKSEEAAVGLQGKYNGHHEEKTIPISLAAKPATAITTKMPLSRRKRRRSKVAGNSRNANNNCAIGSSPCSSSSSTIQSANSSIGHRLPIKSTAATVMKPPRRKKSTAKERERNLEIKARLKDLTEMVPFLGDSELPRIRILRLVNQYILHLRKILEGQYIFCEKTRRWRPLEKEDFAQVVNSEMQIKNSYSHRVQEELMADEEVEEDQEAL